MARSSSGKELISRRQLLRQASLAAGATALAACTPKPAPEPTRAEVVQPTAAEQPTMPPPTAAPEAVTIEWWNPQSGIMPKAIWPKIVDDFVAAYDNTIQVKYEFTGGPPGGGDYVEVLLAHVAAGNPPDCALMWTPPVQFAARGVLMAIDEFMANAKYARKEKFLTRPLNSGLWRGKIYALPKSAANSAIFINVKVFSDKGISTKREDFPKTWDELKALSKEFVQWEGDLLKMGSFMPWVAGWTKPAWSVTNGGMLFDEPGGRYYLDSEQNVEMLSFWQTWLKEQYQGDLDKVNQSGNWGWIGPDTEFWKGNAAMAEDGAWVTTNSGEPIPFEWEVVKAPVGPSGTKSGTAWWPSWQVIPKGSPHSQEAFLFIEFFTTVGMARWYREGCAETLAWTDINIEENYNLKEAEWLGVERAKEIEVWFRDYLKEDAVDMWNSPVEDYANDVLNSAIDAVLHSSKTAKQALTEAQGLAQSKLEEVLQGA